MFDYLTFRAKLKGAILIKDLFFQAFEFLPNELTFTLWTVTKIMAICLPVMISVAYITFAERKIIGYIQARVGPNRVGPQGWLQPIADALKLLTKEVVIPNGANKFLFLSARHFHGHFKRTISHKVLLLAFPLIPPART